MLATDENTATLMGDAGMMEAAAALLEQHRR